MSDNSRIEWTDATWNFIVGCTKVSAGCDNCYAERDVNRWNGDGAFDTIVLKPEKLELPLRWRRPRHIFVNSLSDLFHEAVPAEFIARAFAVMEATPRHTYQILTKRHARMRTLLRSSDFLALVDDARVALTPGCPDFVWPLPNVWLGVSVEDQRWADIRVPALLQTPAAVRFLSCEPLLGPVDLSRYVNPSRSVAGCNCAGTAPGYPQHESYCGSEPDDDAVRPDWVIVGGESGPGARPMHPAWARQIRDDCALGSVAFFFKQHGQYTEVPRDAARPGDVWRSPNPTYPPIPWRGDRMPTYGDVLMRRCRSKHDAGRELDGRTHDDMPNVEVMSA